MDRFDAIHTLGPALAVLAEVVPLLASADTMAADSPSPSAMTEELAVVNTAEELLDAINNDGVRHVVIRSHMNITSPNSTSSTHLRAALLQLPTSTKHIQGDCIEDHPTSQPRLPRQCVLNVRQSFLEASQESSVRLANLYITSSPPFAPPTPALSPALSPSPAEFSIEVEKTGLGEDEARYISYLEIYKADLWMYNVTLEGASEGSIEGVNVLGASSTTGRAYSEGCLFTGFRSATGAAWSIHASRARSDDLPTAAAFKNCSFVDNTALRSGGAIFVERAGALRLEECTFRGNAAPDGADVAAEDPDPNVFSRPPITVHSIGVSRSSEGMDVPSRAIAAAVGLDFPNKNDDFDAEIAAEFAEMYQQQPLPAPVPMPVVAAPAPAQQPIQAPVPAAPAPANPRPVAQAPAMAAALPPPTGSIGPAEAVVPAQTDVISPAEAVQEGSSASGLLRPVPGQELADSAGQTGSNSLPESTLVATLAAAAVLAVFLVALLLFVSRHKARRRRRTEAVAEPASGRVAGRTPGMRSGMDIVSSGPTCITEDFHVLYVLPRIQEEGTGDLAATSSLMGGHTESETA